MADRQPSDQIEDLRAQLKRTRAEFESERARWRSTLDRHALELASMARLHEVTTRLVRLNDLNKIHEEILDAAIGITAADRGSIQMLDDSGAMPIVAQTGFEPSILGRLGEAHAALLAGASLERGQRLIIEDLTRDTVHARVLLDAGVRALQLTPLSGRGGEAIGILATHYSARRRPEEYGLRLLDMLARQGIEVILRRRVEAALRDSEAAIRAFFERATVGAAQLSLDARFISVNDRYCQITGYSREEMLSSITPLDLTPPDERDEVRNRLMPFLRGEIPEYDYEHRYMRKGGGEIWIHATAGMIHDNDGKPLRIAAIVEDITARKKAEEEIASLAQFPNEDPHPVLRIGFDGRILYANHAADALMRELGWSGQGEPPLEIGAMIDDTRQGARNDEIEIQYGNGRAVAFVRAPFPDKGYVNLYGRDTTERRRAEEALRQSRHELEVMNQTLEQRVAERTAEADARTAQLRKLAGELTRTEQRERRRFAQMLHDHLQQLLVGAKFNASVIERRLTDDATRRHLQYVSDLLDQSIAASRTLTIELSPPILFEGKLVPALQWLARWMEENHGLRLTIDAQEQVYPLGEDMRILLFQSVRELVFNVVKHAGVNEAVISLMHRDGMLRIIIEDQGAGFDPSNLNPVTGDFSGFGLLKVKERLNLQGGCFDIVSTPGAGTRVTLVAPLQHARPEPETAAETPGDAGKRIRVLIADDHALIRDGLSQVLQADPGVEVVGTAVDGQQAVELADRLHPDVVLMDVSMPKLSGIEATRHLRRSTRAAAIIGLSMHSETEMAARMREAGAVDYIVKTAPPEEVLAAIRNAYHS